MANSTVYEEVNRKWKATAKILFRIDAGNLEDYYSWISARGSPRKTLVSSLSGKKVKLTAVDYRDDAKVLAFNEVDFTKEFPPLSINQVKDIDSLAAAVSERAAYTGNIILGNSKYVEQSSNVMDSFYVWDCERISHCKYYVCSAQSVYSDCVFGSSGSGYSQYCIRPSSSLYLNRCLEASKCDHCSDLYFCHGLIACNECMFCFGMRNARHAIGNLKLEPQKYAAIKEKLVSEMGQMLLEKKSLPTLFELAASEKPEPALMKKAMHSFPRAAPVKEDLSAVSTAFSETASVVLGTQLPDIRKYEKWLLVRTRKSEKSVSCASGAALLVPEHTDFLLMPRDRLVSEEESVFLSSKISISESEASALSFQGVAKAISKLAYFSPDWVVGNCNNNTRCQVAIESSECHMTILPINSKQCADSFWVRDSEHVFGSNEVRWSSFCIKCYRSEKIQRCFECDSCRDCSGCYFCHNCENVQDSMFCFNVKNKRYAIGNSEVGREKFLAFKKMLLSEISRELSSTYEVKRSIFRIA